MRLILYVEDDLDDQLVFREAVESVNPRPNCITANDGKQALQLLEELVVLPDYVFLDLNMPVMDGKEFLREIKRSEKFKDLSVIVYTTSTFSNDIQECKNLGATNFIVKPSSYQTVVDTIQTVIS
jgi:CheY-like chemotaxis protein